MEDKKYEAGKVEITSTEYRDLVTEAVEARRYASEERSRRLGLESELNKTKEELELTRKRARELESIQEALRYASSTPAPLNIPQPSDAARPAWWSEVTCTNLAKEDN